MPLRIKFKPAGRYFFDDSVYSSEMVLKEDIANANEAIALYQKAAEIFSAIELELKEKKEYSEQMLRARSAFLSAGLHKTNAEKVKKAAEELLNLVSDSPEKDHSSLYAQYRAVNSEIRWFPIKQYMSNMIKELADLRESIMPKQPSISLEELQNKLSEAQASFILPNESIEVPAPSPIVFQAKAADISLPVQAAPPQPENISPASSREKPFSLG